MKFRSEDEAQVPSLDRIVRREQNLRHFPNPYGDQNTDRWWELDPILHVDLGFNQISEIPSDIDRFDQLQTLVMASNLLKSIPLTLCNLRELKSLNLRNNQLEFLPDFEGFENLVVLDVSFNKLKKLPEWVLPRLEVLNISNNKLELLPKSLLQSPRLLEVDASANLLGIHEGLPSGILDWMESRSVFVRMSKLDFSKNKLRNSNVRSLPSSLTRLNLAGNLLSYIPHCLFEAPNLRFLSLAHNSIFVRAFSANELDDPEDDALFLPHLEELDLSYNRLQRVPSSVLALQNLRTLGLEYNDIRVFAPHLGCLPRLLSITIEGNPQRAVGSSTISAGSIAILRVLRDRVVPGNEDEYLAAYDGIPAGGHFSMKSRR